MYYKHVTEFEFHKMRARNNRTTTLQDVLFGDILNHPISLHSYLIVIIIISTSFNYNCTLCLLLNGLSAKRTVPPIHMNPIHKTHNSTSSLKYSMHTIEISFSINFHSSYNVHMLSLMHAAL